MKLLNVQQNTPEWLEARKNYRTASEAAIVLGISPFTTREKFKLIKAGLARQYYSKAMAQGHIQEDQIRKAASKHFGRDFQEQSWVRDNYMASLDGIDGEMLVEIKNSSWTFNHLKNGTVEPHYLAQIQQQLYCSPAEYGYLVAHCPKTGEYAYSGKIYPDDRAMIEIAEAWDRFDRMPVPEGDLDLSDDTGLLALLERYATLKHEADHLTKELASLRPEILEFAPGRTVVCNGHKIAFRRGAKKTNYKKACEDAGLDLSSYQTTGKPTFAISVKSSPFDAIE